MPPKRKVKKKKIGDGRLDPEDKYKKTVQEVEALKDHLALRKHIARRSVEASEEWKQRMLLAESTLDSQERVHRAVSADLTRQYQTKQSEQEVSLSRLDEQLQLNEEQLEWTSNELRRVRETSERVIRERDANLESLNLRVSALSGQCETLLNDQLDKLVVRLANLSTKWDENSTILLTDTNTLLRSHGFTTIALE